MSKRTVIFRADGGPTIGMGHFIRTLAIAEVLNQSFNCIYATQKPTEYQIKEITKVCHGQIELPDNNSHFNLFLTHLNGDEIIVLDNYYFTTDYQKAIKEKGCKLVCIDDMHDKHYFSDVVINHAPGLKPIDFQTETYTALYLGLGYSLLRSTFKNNSFTRENIDFRPKTLLIIFGGADFDNLTLKYLAKMSELHFFNTINIITGDGYRYLKELNKFISSNTTKDINHFHNVSAEKIKELSQCSDIAIAPASTILFELISSFLPVISGYYVENQKNIYTGFAKMGLIYEGNDLHNTDKVIEILEHLSIEKIENQIKNQRNAMRENIDSNIKKIFKDL